MLSFKKYLEQSLEKVQESGLYKEERLILSPQSTEINVKNKKVLNFLLKQLFGLILPS